MEKLVLHIRRTGGESRLADHLIVTNPLLEGEWVPIAAKVGLFQRLQINKVVVLVIMEGVSGTDMLDLCAQSGYAR